MAALSDYLEAQLLDHVLRAETYSPPSTVYVALFTSDASLAALETGSTANEVEAGDFDYERKAVTFDSALTPQGRSESNVDLTWSNMPGVTVQYAAIMDDETGGNVLFFGELESARVITSGDNFTISEGNLTVTLV